MKGIKMLKRLLAVAALSAAAVSGAWAQAQATVQTTPEALLQKLRSTFVNTPFAEVRNTQLAGVFEVVMGKEIAYTDATGRFFLFGNVVDMQTQRNLTQERKSELTRIDVGRLSPADAIKTVRGDGSRTLHVFSDPECPYCKRLESTLAGLDNVTIYTYLYPVLGDKSTASATAIWCTKDRDRAWHDYMVRGQALPAGASCANPIARNVALGQAFGITGTPTLISDMGATLPGAMPVERIEALIGSSRPVAAAGAQR
jgi:thiol:disulfide interchange protein DsbC